MIHKQRKTSLQDFAKELLPLELHQFIPSSFEIVGDIAIIEIPKELIQYDKILGESILKVNPAMKTVLKKAGLHGGEFRTQPLEYLAGEKKTETIYKENEIQLKIDPGTVYFSARLSTERENLCSQLKPQSKVLVMFSGCGPYTYVSVRKQPNLRRIDSIELNPEGHKYALESLMLNKSSLKKSDLYKQVLEYCRANHLPINERLILANLNTLKLQFFNENVKLFAKTNQFPARELYVESCENWIFEKTPKECYDKLNTLPSGPLYISLKEIKTKENYLINLILFAQKFEFILYNSDTEVYVCDTMQTKAYFLNILEGETLETVTKYDEIFMPLPKDARLFLDSAFTVANINCLVHMYDFVHETGFPQETEFAIQEAAAKFGKLIEIKQTRKVGQYSPGKFRVCCDFIIKN